MYINDELVGRNTSGSDNLVLLPRDRDLLEFFHQLSEIKQKACLAHMKLDVELELEFRDKG